MLAFTSDLNRVQHGEDAVAEVHQLVLARRDRIADCLLEALQPSVQRYQRVLRDTCALAHDLCGAARVLAHQLGRPDLEMVEVGVTAPRWHPERIETGQYEPTLTYREPDEVERAAAKYRQIVENLARDPGAEILLERRDKR